LTPQAVDLILGVIEKAGLSEPEKTDARNLLVIIENHSQTLCLYQIIDSRTIGFSLAAEFDAPMQSTENCLSFCTICGKCDSQ
jgi:hypothetical protein